MKDLKLFNKLQWILLNFLSLFLFTSSLHAQISKQNKPRIVITCDPELDDNNSLIRFLLYSTDFDIEGLVYASSQFHWKGDGKGTKWFVEGREYTRFGLNMGPMESWRWSNDERFIHDAVEAYEKVYPNLIVHNADYPTPDYLKSKIKWGNIEFDGVFKKDTEGSNLIKALILDDKPGPLYITAWGGASTISRALKVIEDEFESTKGWPRLKEKIESKVVLCLSGDQDNTFENFIKPHFPGIEVLKTTFSTTPLGYNAQNGVSDENQIYYSPKWTYDNILYKGPLGSLYRVWGDGKQMVKDDIFDFFGFSGLTEEELRVKGYVVWTPLKDKNSFLGEGDTHTYLNLIDNGLRADQDQTFNGWSRQQIDESIDFETLSVDRIQEVSKELDYIPAVQNGLAARFLWSVTPVFNDANHEPKISGPLEYNVSAGKQIKLKVSITDPDDDRLQINWVPFNKEKYSGELLIENPFEEEVTVLIPSEAKKGEAIHLVVEVTDDGIIPMTRYHRIILKVV